MHERQLRVQMVQIARLCYDRGLLVAMDGNLSALLPGGEVLCTRAGCHKGLLTDEDLIVCDRRGKKLRGEGEPTSELRMHLAAYDERPDVRAVVHAHPPIAVAFTLADVSLASCVLPEVVLTLGVVPTVRYATTGTEALAEALRPYLRQHDCVLMDRHGAVCVGGDLLRAFCNLETLEHTAKIIKAARDLGGAKALPADEAVKLRSLGLDRYGGPPAAVARKDAPGADLPPSCTCDGGAAPDAVEGGARTAGLVAAALSAAPAAGAPSPRAVPAPAPTRAPAAPVIASLDQGALVDALAREVLAAMGRR
jgi:L-fuculose-phosphate aldolase